MLALVVVDARARSSLMNLATSLAPPRVRVLTKIASAIVGLTGIGLAVTACKGGVDAQPPITTRPTASALGSAGPLPDQGPIWTRAARSLDPIDLGALGREFGGARLLALVDHPASRAVALAALPFASDAEVAFAGLVDRAKASTGADAAACLDAIVASLDLPSEDGRRRGEWLAAEPIERSLPTLLAIAKDAARTDEERGLAVTVLRRLRERGFRGVEDPPSLE